MAANERETEKPKVSGWSAKRRLRIVDLPEPEGPEMTIGRCFCVALLKLVHIRVCCGLEHYLRAPLRSSESERNKAESRAASDGMRQHKEDKQ